MIITNEKRAEVIAFIEKNKNKEVWINEGYTMGILAGYDPTSLHILIIPPDTLYDVCYKRYDKDYAAYMFINNFNDDKLVCFRFDEVSAIEEPVTKDEIKIIIDTLEL